MKAILLTAGFGSRLRPLTEILPKCLLPVNGIPLLEYWFAMLTGAGIDSILMNLHYLADIMKKWVELTEYAENVHMVYEEELMGTGGTLLHNRDFAGNEPVMLVHADNLCLANIGEFIDAHNNRPEGTEITMMTFNTQTPETCGIVEIDNCGIVRGFHEKTKNPPGNLANAAVYIIEPTIFDFLASLNKKFIDFSTEVLPIFADAGKIYTFHNSIYHRDIGNLESYLAAQIEYPQKKIIYEKNNSWLKLCKSGNNRLVDEFVSALSHALNADTIAIDDLFNNRVNYLFSENRMVIICCSSLEGYLEHIREFIETKGLRKSNIIVFIIEVPSGFSSVELFENTGLKSLVLCSSGN